MQRIIKCCLKFLHADLVLLLFWTRTQLVTKNLSFSISSLPGEMQASQIFPPIYSYLYQMHLGIYSEEDDPQ